MLAAKARINAARANARGLKVGPHEVIAQAIIQRRDVRGIGVFSDYDVQLSRAFRLPGKAALDRRAGEAGVAAADNRADDARHQAALLLSQYWWGWLAASAEARTLEDVTDVAARAVKATSRRLDLRDASAVELDQAQAAEATARAAARAAQGRAIAARAILAANFPGLPLPAAAPSLPEPTLPPEGLAELARLVVIRSHEIGASAADLAQADALSARAAKNRIADPSVGVRGFSEQGGNERGVGLVLSMPLGGRARTAAADKAAAMASSASAELSATRVAITAIAAEDAALAEAYYAAHAHAHAAAGAALAAAQRLREGHKLGGVDLSDLLTAERVARDAALDDIRARIAALVAITRLRIDSHTLWRDDDVEQG